MTTDWTQEKYECMSRSEVAAEQGESRNLESFPAVGRPRRNQTMPVTNAVLAVYDSHDQAEAAVRDLHKDGFDMKKLSIVGKRFHTEEHVVGYYNAGDRMLYWGKQGAFWGGLWGLLFGSAFFWVPGVGPLLVAGPLVAWMVGALEGAVVVGGLTALGGALASIGIPENSVVQYETQVKSGKLLLVAHGTADEVQKARNLLQQSEANATVQDRVAVAVACSGIQA
jgi:hypothetical protein